MVLAVRRKKQHAVRRAIPAFINLWRDGSFMVEEHGLEVMREMQDYDVYIKPKDIWLDLSYAHYEGFLDSEQLRKWKSSYKLLIKKAIKNTKGNRYLSKNPPNTGRIKVLLEMFPDAKFIHIHRNPIEVFLSTQNFYNKMLPPLQLQSISKEEIDLNIQRVYKKIMSDYLNQKELIPSKNLIEVSYDELEENPTAILNRIYETLNFDNYDLASKNFENYIDKLKSYKKILTR